MKKLLKSIPIEVTVTAIFVTTFTLAALVFDSWFAAHSTLVSAVLYGVIGLGALIYTANPPLSFDVSQEAEPEVFQKRSPEATNYLGQLAKLTRIRNELEHAGCSKQLMNEIDHEISQVYQKYTKAA